MLTTVYTIIVLILILIVMVILDSKFKIFERVSKRINDYFDVRKYKKERNKYENKYNARNDDYISALETVQTLVIEKMKSDKQIIKQKAEIKELKRIIAEEMEPKKKRGKKSEKN